MGSNNAKQITLRYQWVRVGLALLAVIVLGRLFYIQIIRHEFYAVKADSAHQQKLIIEAKRGQIYTETVNGEREPLAINQTLKRVVADPRFVGDPQLTAKAIAKITGRNPEKYRKMLAADSNYQVIEPGLSIERGKQVKQLNLKGVFLQDISHRVYPEESLAAHVLGFVNAEGTGQYGVEQYLDEELSGSDGLLSGAFDTRGVPIATSETTSLEPVDGQDVVLSIDRNVQRYVERALKEGVEKYQAASASAVVMDPRNGQIIAMANYPTYSPSKYQKVDDIEVFVNDSISSPYETGSVFKPLAMSLGLDSGAVTPDSTYYDTSAVRVDDFTIRNAGASITATRDMTEVITKSVNTGMVHVLKSLDGDNSSISDADKQKLYEFYSGKLRLDRTTGVELAGETLGIFSKPSDSSDARYANMTFGQGISVTLLQNLAAEAAIINGGTYYQPSVISKTVDADGRVTDHQPMVLESDVISQESSDQIRAMMRSVVDSGGGIWAQRSGYEIGGKTGSAQIADRESGGYIDGAEIGSFVGFGADEQPGYIAMVRMEEPQRTLTPYAGSGAAAPVFADISNWLIDYYGYQPN